MEDFKEILNLLRLNYFPGDKKGFHYLDLFPCNMISEYMTEVQDSIHPSTKSKIRSLADIILRTPFYVLMNYVITDQFEDKVYSAEDLAKILDEPSSLNEDGIVSQDPKFVASVRAFIFLHVIFVILISFAISFEFLVELYCNTLGFMVVIWIEFANSGLIREISEDKLSFSILDLICQILTTVALNMFLNIVWDWTKGRNLIFMLQFPILLFSLQKRFYGSDSSHLSVIKILSNIQYVLRLNFQCIVAFSFLKKVVDAKEPSFRYCLVNMFENLCNSFDASKLPGLFLFNLSTVLFNSVGLSNGLNFGWLTVESWLTILVSTCDSILTLFSLTYVLCSFGLILESQMRRIVRDFVSAESSNIVDYLTRGFEAFVFVLLALQSDIQNASKPISGRVNMLRTLLWVLATLTASKMSVLGEEALNELKQSFSQASSRNHVRILTAFLLPNAFLWYMGACCLFAENWDNSTFMIVVEVYPRVISAIECLFDYLRFHSRNSKSSIDYDEFQDETPSSLVGLTLSSLFILEIGNSTFLFGHGLYRVLGDSGLPVGWNWFVLAMVTNYHAFKNLLQRLNVLGQKEQIKLAAEKVVANMNVTEGSQLEPIKGDTCPICHGTFDTGIIVSTNPCNHTFHRRCIKKWIIVRANCPLCNTQMIPKEDQQAQ